MGAFDGARDNRHGAKNAGPPAGGTIASNLVEFLDHVGMANCNEEIAQD
jgi:hypothetical protein